MFGFHFTTNKIITGHGDYLRNGDFVFHIVGIVLLILWSLGFLFPYSPLGFLGILLMTASLNYMLKKIINFKPLKARIHKIPGIKFAR